MIACTAPCLMAENGSHGSSSMICLDAAGFAAAKTDRPNQMLKELVVLAGLFLSRLALQQPSLCWEYSHRFWEGHMGR